MYHNHFLNTDMRCAIGAPASKAAPGTFNYCGLVIKVLSAASRARLKMP